MWNNLPIITKKTEEHKNTTNKTERSLGPIGHLPKMKMKKHIVNNKNISKSETVTTETEIRRASAA